MAQGHIEVSLALFLIENQALTESIAASFSRSKTPSTVKIRALESFIYRFDSERRLPVFERNVGESDLIQPVKSGGGF